MPINQRGIDLIKHFEGKMLTGYIDPVGIPTIGYGHTGDDVKVGKTITEEEAEALLRGDLQKFADGVRNRLSVKVTNNAFAALVSFSFNVGLGAFGNSTLRRKLNEGDTSGAAREFPRWVKGTINGRKVTLPGLVRRREAERKLFQTSDGEGDAIIPAEPPGGPGEDIFFHIVTPGETFNAIAERNGLSVEVLLCWNPHIADPSLLFPGDLVRFEGTQPVGPDPTPTPEGTDDTAHNAATAEAAWYALARLEVGVSEIKGKLRHNNRIIEYHRSTSLDKKLASRDETPWCSSFVNWCVEGSGLKGTDSARARSWMKWGEKLDLPREGCIVVFARPSAGPQAGHVGFYVRETAKRIRVLGGNQKNQVKESNYGKDDFLGYRWPKGKPKPPKPLLPEKDREADTIYIVQHGDTLGEIAARAGVTLGQIRAWNPQILNINRILPGDSILLVGTDAPAAEEPPLPADSKAPWFDLANRERGVTEEDGPVRNNPRILEYHASTTLPGNLARIDETAWCSSFVNWCIAKTGLEGTNSAAARSWAKWGRKLNKPREGCIVVLTRPAGGPNAGHVGFYVGETATQIRLLGGNQSDSVKVSNYAKNRLISYRWPTGVPVTGPPGGVGTPGRTVRRPFLSRLRLFRKRLFG